MSNSRRTSSPITKKKIAIRPSLIQKWRSPPNDQSPSSMVRSVAHSES
jgi:hypothetical protein